MIADFAYSALENIINCALKLDPDTQERLQLLRGKIIKVVITDWSLDCYLILQDEGVKLQHQCTDKPETTIHGTFSGLAKVACAGGSGASLFEQGVQVEGNIELAEKIREILNHLDLDWEGSLAKIFGDTFTHAFSWRAKKAVKACQQTSQHLVNQYREYWQFEKDYLPAAEQVEVFYQEIDRLRDDVERASARVARLEKRSKR